MYAGAVGITLIVHWSEPLDRNNPDDIEAAERLMQIRLGLYANPIYGDGDYPAILKAQLAKKAKELGLSASPLQEFTEKEKRLNRGNELYM